MSDPPGEEVVLFKKKGKRNIRQRRTEEEEAAENLEDADLTEKVELYKELRKLRERPHGTSATTLALGKKMNMEEEIITSNSDPFKSGSGGMIDMAALNSGNYQMNAEEDAYEIGIGNIGTQFSAETNTRDEDAEMLKYIEGKLQDYKKAASKGGGAEDEDEAAVFKFLSPEEAALLAVPEHLRKNQSSNRSEEMLSNQMLSGIPEVDLGIEVKIKNIEATEEAKQKIIRDRMNRKETTSVAVPVNMSVNFVQHNRFNIEDPARAAAAKRPKKEKEPEKPKKVVVVGAEPEEVGGPEPGGQKEKVVDKASDDFHFEKFKKQFRRF